ncbi:MAG: DNA mismatch repair endonuclease MutL [Oscillospiraceae bacterium]|nr:DNA mismatch repair endonuclease MutL [Oscillospiraceae bacterium]
MPTITLLDKHIAELIAAGEVVERPASAVKELMENAIDAGATTVTVEITAGGTGMIRVADNGAGIPRADVPTAFLRHATSKVRTAEDLERIGTLGFRGEALASIAAVSKVELLTRTAGEDAGTRYLIEGGEQMSLEDAGCPVGTSITVRELFYNVPARMKFLKTDAGEGSAAAGVADRIALSHPEVSVRFIRDGKEELLTPGDGDIRACVYAVLGREFAGGLLPADYALGGVTVSGFITRPEAARANRTMQHFFINGRYVKTRTGMAALEQACKNSVMAGKFPGCVLYLTMPFETVDANVHPAKIEVRFVNEKPVFDAVYHGVRTALERDGAAQTERIAAAKVTVRDPAVFAPVIPPLPVPPPAIPPAYRPSIDIKVDVKSAGAPPEQIKLPEPSAVAPPKKEPPRAVPEPADMPVGSVKYIGEVLHTYLLAEAVGSLWLIDKHAAHERILYNQLKNNPETASQQLLEPAAASLSREEYAALAEELELLARAGFEAEDFGGTLLVRAVPMLLPAACVDDALREIAGRLIAGRREAVTGKMDWIYHSVACRAAVKAGGRQQPEELAALAGQALTDPAVRYCPHGRPVCVEITERQLEKLFGRIGARAAEAATSPVRYP